MCCQCAALSALLWSVLSLVQASVTFQYEPRPSTSNRLWRHDSAFASEIGIQDKSASPDSCCGCNALQFLQRCEQDLNQVCGHSYNKTLKPVFFLLKQKSHWALSSWVNLEIDLMESGYNSRFKASEKKIKTGRTQSYWYPGGKSS